MADKRSSLKIGVAAVEWKLILDYFYMIVFFCDSLSIVRLQVLRRPFPAVKTACVMVAMAKYTASKAIMTVNAKLIRPQPSSASSACRCSFKKIELDLEQAVCGNLPSKQGEPSDVTVSSIVGAKSSRSVSNGLLI